MDVSWARDIQRRHRYVQPMKMSDALAPLWPPCLVDYYRCEPVKVDGRDIWFVVRQSYPTQNLSFALADEFGPGFQLLPVRRWRGEEELEIVRGLHGATVPTAYTDGRGEPYVLLKDVWEGAPRLRPHLAEMLYWQEECARAIKGHTE